jgi:ABC-2 type transport system ATP-binding protein
MKQKLALCRALLPRPRVLFLDEPTTGLDLVSRREFWDVLATLADEGIAIVVATPYLDEAERCHRIALMYEGTIRETGTLILTGIAIGARDLRKTFGNFRAVKGVTLEIRYGEIYGLLGANGAGKTTTIKTLCGLPPASRGEISLVGRSQDLRDPALRQRIG